MDSGYVNANGQRLYYEIDGEGEDLLLIAGLGQDVTGWAFQIPRFVQRFRVIAFDNRDVGRSSEASAPYAIGDMAEDAASLLDELGIASANVLGYSMGGAIAQELALRHPKKIKKLILACTTAQLARYQINFFAPLLFIREHDSTGKVSASLQLFLTMTRDFLKLRGATHMMLEMLRSPPYPQSNAAMGRQIDASVAFDVVDRLPQIRVPTCVIAGGQDVLTPEAEVRGVALSIAGSKYTVLDDGGHGLLFEIPEKFNKCVSSFLELPGTC